MAEDLSSKNEFPYYHNFTAGDSATTEILLPSSCSRISIGSQSKALWVCRNGCTDGGSIPTNKGFVPSANYLSLQIGKGLERSSSIFVASQSGNAEVSVILEDT